MRIIANTDEKDNELNTGEVVCGFGKNMLKSPLVPNRMCAHFSVGLEAHMRLLFKCAKLSVWKGRMQLTLTRRTTMTPMDYWLTFDWECGCCGCEKLKFMLVRAGDVGGAICDPKATWDEIFLFRKTNMFSGVGIVSPIGASRTMFEETFVLAIL